MKVWFGLGHVKDVEGFVQLGFGVNMDTKQAIEFFEVPVKLIMMRCGISRDQISTEIFSLDQEDLAGAIRDWFVHLKIPNVDDACMEVGRWLKDFVHKINFQKLYDENTESKPENNSGNST